MPIQRGSVTFARFTALLPDDKRRLGQSALAKGLKKAAFEPVDPRSDEDRSAGFVELEDPESTDFGPGTLMHGPWALFAWRIDQIKIPASKLRDALTRWERTFVEEQQRKPARSERAAMRLELREGLRKRATPVTRTTEVSWNLTTGRLLIWTASRKVVDEVTQALEAAFDGLKTKPHSPDTEKLQPTPELLAVDEPTRPPAGAVKARKEAAHG